MPLRLLLEAMSRLPLAIMECNYSYNAPEAGEWSKLILSSFKQLCFSCCMPLPTYLHPSSHDLSTSINTCAECRTYTPSAHTHSLTPSSYTPPPVQKKKGLGGRTDGSRSPTKGKNKKVVSLLTQSRSKQASNNSTAI